MSTRVNAPRNATYQTATQKQFDFLRVLLAERVPGTFVTVERVQQARAAAVAGTLSRGDASRLINDLKREPKAAAPSARRDLADPEIPAGVYRSGDDLFRVYLGQNSGRMLAKQIIFTTTGPEVDWSDVPFDQHEIVAEQQEAMIESHVTYEYVGRASTVLAADAVRLSVAEVGALGKSWDHCLCCGRRLDDPESVDRGIGPVCARKYDVVEDAA